MNKWLSIAEDLKELKKIAAQTGKPIIWNPKSKKYEIMKEFKVYNVRSGKQSKAVYIFEGPYTIKELKNLYGN